MITLISDRKKSDVWIIGSSIIRDAYQIACRRSEGGHLGLQSLGYNVIWEYQGGMNVSDLKPTIEYLMNFNNPPKFLIIHCGGNDIGKRPSVEIIWDIKKLYYWNFALNNA